MSHVGLFGRSVGALAAAGLVLALSGSDAFASSSLRARLIKDLDATPGAQGSAPAEFFAWNGHGYFRASTLADGAELFRTNGTAAGTRLAHDFARGTDSSNARPIGAVGGRLIVEANDGFVDTQLWAFADDGSAPVRLTSFAASLTRFSRFADLGGVILVSGAPDGATWATDGTAAGTRSLAAAPLGWQWRPHGLPCVVGGVATFMSDSGSVRSLVSTDGTVAGSQYAAVVSSEPPSPGYVDTLAVGGRCQFLMSRTAFGPGWILWSSNGTPGTTTRVASSDTATPLGVYAIGGVLHVAQWDQQRFQLLRNTPGTSDFAVVVDRPSVAQPRRPVAFGGGVVFALTESAQNGLGAYFTDGTTTGTRRLYPTQGGQPPLPSPESAIAVVGGAVVFQSRDAGLLVDVATGAAMPAPPSTLFDFAASADLGAVRLGAGTGPNGVEPWTSDGTSPGTRPLVDLRPGTADGLGLPGSTSVKSESASNGAMLFFTAPLDGSGSRYALWRTDGIDAGTRRLPPALLEGAVATPQTVGSGVAFFDAPSGSGRVAYADPAFDTVVSLSTTPVYGGPISTGDGVVFLAAAPNDTALYGSVDGAPAGIVEPGFGGSESDLKRVGRLGGVAVFHGGLSRDIWRSDGTAPGTFKLLDADDFPRHESQYASVVSGGKLFFVNCAQITCAVYATDGTAAGTTRLRELPGSFYSIWAGQSFAVLDGRVLFMVGGSLWVSDGTPGGTDILFASGATSVSTIAAVGGHVHMAFGCAAPPCRYRYAVSDGTKAGTRFVDAPPGLVPQPELMTAVGDVVVFSCETPATGVELCVADAAGGTLRLLADIYPGRTSSRPRLLGTIANGAIIKADDGLYGYEPWIVEVPPDRIFRSGFEAGVP